MEKKIIKFASISASAGQAERWKLCGYQTSGFTEELCPICRAGGLRYQPSSLHVFIATDGNHQP